MGNIEWLVSGLRLKYEYSELVVYWLNNKVKLGVYVDGKIEYIEDFGGDVSKEGWELWFDEINNVNRVIDRSLRWLKNNSSNWYMEYKK